MAEIHDTSSGRRHRLRATTVLGRSRSADLCVDDPRLSGQHAVLRWTGDGWELRDLGSRNGTFHQGARLPAGERVTLAVGDRLGFGADDGRFVVADLAALVALAVADDGEVAEARGGLLALPPGADPPEAVVYLAAGGAWVVERDGQPEPVDGAVDTGGRRWALELPDAVVQTLVADVPSIETIHLLFQVSRDEEYAAMTVRHGARDTAFEARVHHYLLLTLARRREADQAQGLPVEAQGWVTVDALSRMLRLDEGQINLQVFRARKELAAAGIEDAAQLVERRSPGRQLRLGVASFEVAVV